MSNFQKVKEFNSAFGLDIPRTPDPNLLENKSLVKLRIDLIEEEVQELKQALQEKNQLEVLDALADILYVVYGAGIAFGMDLDKAFDLVHKSNMSKLCLSEQEAKETVEWYKKEYEEKRLSYDSPVYQYKQDLDKYVVFNKSSGKILKNKYYKPVDLSGLF
jgi:predicted HAD superfamily Cof-like phosphohydrolase